MTCHDLCLAYRLRVLRNYGSRIKYHHEIAGFNARSDELQAAFLRERLAWLDVDNRRRQVLARQYRAALAGLPGLRLPGDMPGAEPVWHLFVVRHLQRDRLAERLRVSGIETLIHYPVPVHRQPAYAGLPGAADPQPLADDLAAEVLSLPIGPTLSDLQQQRVIDAVFAACMALAREPVAA